MEGVGCQPAAQRGKTSKVTRFHSLRDYCPWLMTSRDFHNLLGQGSMYRSDPFFFLINGWVGEKRWCHVPILLIQGLVSHMDGCLTFCVL